MRQAGRLRDDKVHFGENMTAKRPSVKSDREGYDRITGSERVHTFPHLGDDSRTFPAQHLRWLPGVRSDRN